MEEEQINRPVTRLLTGRQRNMVVISTTIANDMDTNGTVPEQHTAALLRIVADAITRGYEAELVGAVRVWAAEREQSREG